MKVAICFYGLVGSSQHRYGVGKNLNPKISYNYYKKNVFKYLKNYDVFIHSQSIEEKKKLIKLYKPKLSFFEKKRNFFFKVITNFSILKLMISRLVKNKGIREPYDRSFANYSRWYSTKKVIELKQKFEKKNNFKYDLVFLTRLDWAFITKFKLKKNMSKYFILSHHNTVPSPRNRYKDKIKKDNKTFVKGIADYWFITSSEKMNKFSNFYNHLNSYDLSPHYGSLQYLRKLNFKMKFYKFRGLHHEAVRRINKSKS